ncbi:MAG: hypothetical protein NT095_14060, partial [Burkholderiales bacterium]|nr:hypothetical protein [Burkholderiales bacterium]
MADTPGFNFDAFLPGFDFLKQFAQANTAASKIGRASDLRDWVVSPIANAEIGVRAWEVLMLQSDGKAAMD